MRDEKQKLEEKLNAANEKIESMKATILSLSKKQENLSLQLLHKTSDEVRVRSEIISLKGKITELSSLIKKTSQNENVSNIVKMIENGFSGNANDMEKIAQSVLGEFQVTYNRLIDNFSTNVFQKLVQCESELRGISLKISSKPQKTVKYITPKKPRVSPIKKSDNSLLDPHLFD